MYSNAYIFRYASIMVVLVAAILSGAATLLKPYQEKNIMVDKMQGILASANIPSTAQDAISIYDANIEAEIAINKNGEIVSEFKGGKQVKGDARPFDLKMKAQLYNESQGKPFELPLYKAKIKGKKIYIVPLYGKGLWGPIWGNIALDENFSKVLGVNFDHKGETPGLGAEINTKDFQEQFIGKTIFNKDGKFMSITVKKGGVVTMPDALQVHGVDAISGGTITSNGVSKMLNDVLKLYVPFVENTLNK
jgi:Na+-transporting NADH:ubiquinone oxidoreductase subunit C